MASTSLHTISVVGDCPKRRRVVDEGNQRTHDPSLLQMWRRIEDESNVKRKSKALKQQCNKTNDDTSAQTCEMKRNTKSGSLSEGHSELKACVHDGQQNFPDIDEADERKAKQDSGDRMTYDGAREHYFNAPQLRGSSVVQGLGDNDYEEVRIAREWGQLAAQDISSSPYKKVSTKINAQTETVRDGLTFNKSESRPNCVQRKIHRVCGKQTLLDLLLKAEKQRQSEIQDLTKRCAVSKFCHRLRIQSLLKSRFLRNTNIANEKPKTRHIAARELELLKQRQTVSDLRDGFLLRTDSFGRRQLASVSGCMPSNPCTNTAGTKDEVTNMIHEENSVAKEDCRLLNLQSFDTVNSEEARHASDESLHVVNKCDDHMDTIIDDMNNDHLMETVDAPSLVTSRTEYAESIHSDGYEAWNAREGEDIRDLDAFAGSNSLRGSKDNALTSELSELVGRKRVSNLLGSGFQEYLNSLLLKYVERQARASVSSDLADNVMPYPASAFMRQELEILTQNVHTLGTSCPVNRFGGSLWQILGEPLGIRDLEVISDMRMDITTLQLRMNDMQRMLAACMDMQLELQRSIRLEVAATLRGSVSQDANDCGRPIDKSKWDLVQKGICCVCSHSSIDSLLYRCGHMCACTTCANRLFEEKNKCPMCQSPILKVIRAHCKTR